MVVKSKRKPWLKWLIIFLAIIFAIIDFYPEFNVPQFRYTGSDPNHFVWNIGYPLALFIFDNENSPFIFAGPVFFIALPIQILIIMAVHFARILIKKNNR
ncbi:MAG: hypothetical protein WBP43_05975 [Chitinophagales bacterium]